MTAYPRIQSYIGPDAGGYGSGNTAGGIDPTGNYLIVLKTGTGASGNIIVYDIATGAEVNFATATAITGSAGYEISNKWTVTAGGLIVMVVGAAGGGTSVLATIDPATLRVVSFWNQIFGTGGFDVGYLGAMLSPDNINFVFAAEPTTPLDVYEADGATLQFAGHRFSPDEPHPSSCGGQTANVVFTVCTHTVPTSLAAGVYKTTVNSGAGGYNIATWPGTPNAFISTSKIGTILPSAIDATWTNFSSFTLLGCDASDGNLIAQLATTDSVAHQHYLAKLDAVTLAIIWQTAGLQPGAGVSQPNNTMVWTDTHSLHSVDLSTGTDTATTPYGQPSVDWSQIGQFYDYKTNSIFTWGEYTDAGEPPYPVSGTTSWGATDNWYRIILGAPQSSCCEEQIIVDPAIVALLANRDLRVAHLVQFDFLTTPKYVWNGNRDLLTADGRRWSGLKKLGGIAGMQEQGGITSAQLSFTISGIDSAVLALAISEDRTEYVNRIVTVWLQFFDANWQKVGSPIARTAGIMEGIKVSQSRDKDGISTRTITLTAENIFYGRGSPPASYYTDRDQQLRSPGDRGLGFVVETQNTVIPEPW